MRYILKDTGYIEAISFTHEVECNNKTCIEYTGSVPEGYENLAEWSDNANINAYKIVDGNLTYDSEEDTRLQNLWEEQQGSSSGIGGYDGLPVGSVIEFDGDEVPVGYEEIGNIITNGPAVKTGRIIDGKAEYIKRISTILGAGVKNSNNLHWDIQTDLLNVTATRNIDAFLTNSIGAVLDCNMFRFNGTTVLDTSHQAYFTTSTGIIAFETAGFNRQGLEFTVNIYFTYN